METYETDEQRVEALKKWWKDNGRSVIAGLVVGIFAVVGYQQWLSYKTRQAQTASTIYQDMVQQLASKNMDAFTAKGNQLVKDYSATSYAVLASFAMAKQALDNKNNSEAINHLQWVVDNSSEPGFQHIARIRLVRVLLLENKPDLALSLIESVQDPSFAADYDELRGDIYVTKNDLKSAQQAYESALAGNIQNRQKRELIEMKLHDLAVPNEQPAAQS